MSCTYFMPEIEVSTGKWVRVGQPSETFEEADKQLIEYLSNPKVISTRVIQSSCKEIPRKRCCGK